MHLRCICGSTKCNHYTVFDGQLVDFDPNKTYNKWEDKDTEDFKDRIMNINYQRLMEDGMY
jgi:hypothetical protein